MNKVKELVYIAVLAGILVVSKELLAFLPNIELVSFLVIIYALVLGKTRTMMICTIFSFVQTLLYGIGPWTPMYFIVWPLLAVMTDICQIKLKTEFRLALLSGSFGLLFGLMMSIPYFLMGFEVGLAYYLKGIPFDLIHGIGNYLVMLILYPMVYPQFKKIVFKI